MILNRPTLRRIVKEVLDEMEDKASSEYDVAGDDIIVQAMGDDIMAFLEGLPDDQKAELLDTFMGILTQQDPDIKNY